MDGAQRSWISRSRQEGTASCPILIEDEGNGESSIIRADTDFDQQPTVLSVGSSTPPPSVQYETTLLQDTEVHQGTESNPVIIIDDDHHDPVNDMTYEQLMELGEHIGVVSTGLSENEVLARLHGYICFQNVPGARIGDICCICQDELQVKQRLAELDCDCSTSYHYDCVKRWLMMKNCCPICKLTGLRGDVLAVLSFGMV